MRVPLEELLEKLGVDRVLSPYETQPWVYYDSDMGITCSAEVRMGPDSEDLEAEIQFLYDEVQEEEYEVIEGIGDEKRVRTETKTYSYKQIMLMRAQPSTQSEWSPKYLLVKGEDYTNKFGDWDKKGCEFFRACIGSLLMSEIPDIEMLLEKELSDDDGWGGGRSGRVGRKSPKIKPASLLGMKK